MAFLLGKWLQAIKRKAARGAHTRHGANRMPAHRSMLRLEALEDRCLLSGGISLTPSEAAPQPVGEQIVWTATASDLGANPVYQFRVGSENGPMRVVRDFSLTNNFTWAPMEEGTYDIQVIAKQGFNATSTESADALDLVNSRVTGTEAVITPTSNPLVALYSVPPTEPGPGPHGTVHVEFSVAGDQPSWQSTNELPSEPGRSTNFFVAGMLPSTTYEMRDVFSDGTTSSPLLFTTGSLPTTLSFPAFTVQQPPGPGSDGNQDMIFQQLPRGTANVPNSLATDLQGRVVWYYDVSQSGFTATNGDQSLDAPLPGSANVLREIDLAGNSIRETNLDAINAQLTAMGDGPVYSLTHDVTRLPHGQTAMIGVTERTVNINGAPTNYIGNDVVVLDQNFQVAWVWDAFDHLDVNRGPVLGEVLNPGSADPDAAVPNLPAVDWLHANALSWSPGDGNLVLSLRHQDWVIKIDYENGAGDGRVLWRLGQGGDFTVNSTDSNPWFSHQHDAHLIDATTLIVFDNGNTRRASDPTADSRGQVWKLDQQTMTATLEFNVDMGSYSPMFGAAQRLSNGDYSFLSGAQGQAPNQIAQSIEVRPDGSKAYVLQLNKLEYRSFRFQTLYEGVSDQLAGDGQTSQQQPAGGAGPALANPTGNALFGGVVVAAPVVDGTTTSDLTTEPPPAFQGLDVALAQFYPGDPSRVVSPVFALSFGAGSESLPALHGLRQAVGQIPPNPISPVFFGLANGTPATPDAVDQVFAGLEDGTVGALWTF